MRRTVPDIGFMNASEPMPTAATTRRRRPDGARALNGRSDRPAWLATALEECATQRQEADVETDHQAPVRESSEIAVDAPPDVVWDTLTDFRSWPGWMPGVKSVEIDEAPRVGTRFEWKAGPGRIRSEIVEFDPLRSVAWTGRTFGVNAVHVWRTEAQGEATSVLTEESWAGPLARVLRGWAAKTVKKAIDDGLAALKAESERRARSR